MNGSEIFSDGSGGSAGARPAGLTLGAYSRAGLAALVLFLVGCDQIPDLAYLPDAAQPTPIADLPQEMRIENWVGRADDGYRGGSCVHASTINTFRAIGRPDLEQVWVNNRSRGYEGPETGYGITSKFKEQGIPYASTSDGDVELLEMATETHRPGIIFYYPSHCINFVEFAEVDGREVAVLLDNNFTDKYIVVDRAVFERSWRYYGGFSLIPWVEPCVPRTFPRAIEKG